MTIQESIRSGKRFKRRGWNDMFWMFFPNPNAGDLPLIVEDILADDWEIEEKKVVITYDDLSRAMCPCLENWVDLIAKELGLL